MGTMIGLTSSDGHRFRAYRTQPTQAVRGAVVILQEIFGVNRHIRGVADRYAGEGYVAIAPALFDRVAPGYETGYSPEDIAAGRALMERIDQQSALADIATTVASAAGDGKVAVIGYCWGGTLAWRAAAHVGGLACAVAYYGGSIAKFAAERPACPMLLHFGEKDSTPSPADARAVVSAHPSVSAHFYDAGHGFNCDERGSYHEPSATLARQRTLAFLSAHVG